MHVYILLCIYLFTGTFQNEYTPHKDEFRLVTEAKIYVVLVFEEGKDAYVTPSTKVCGKKKIIILQ